MRIFILTPLFILIFTKASLSQIEATFDYGTDGQRVCLVDVTINKNPASATLHFRDAAMNNAHQTTIYRRQLYGGGSDWLLQIDDLPAGTTSWTDTDVALGEVWEYQIRRTHNDGDAIGYASAAIYYDQSDYRGQMILAIADDLPNALPDEILRLKRDLTADGWFVNELIIAEGDVNFEDGERVVSVKDSIAEIYHNAPSDDKPKVLFVLGHIPLPRSGQGLQAPDGHFDATGARGSDCYYADMDGIFTDTAIYDTSALYHTLTKNIPGDYKWDQDKIPSELEMAFGRVSFRRITSGWAPGEIAAMKTYLDRLHNYRYISNEQKIGKNTAFNETGYLNSTDASYRCLPALSGGSNVYHSSIAAYPGHNQWVKDNGPFLWYMSNQYVPLTAEWDTIGMDALVYSSDQSNFGYGDLPNNTNSDWHASTIRKILSYDTKCLIAIWTTTAVNVFHQAGVGEPLGYACKFIMDHDTTNQIYEKVEQPWDSSDWWNRTHFNFFGDPTLRLYQTYPPADLQVANNTSEFTLEWLASSDENLIGYHVYKSNEEFGIYQKITGASPIANTSFTDPAYQAGNWYMVRAIAEQTTGSGIFLNPSHGIFIQGQIILTTDNTLEWGNGIRINPNPVKEQLHIFSEVPINRLEIWDGNGKLVLKKEMHSIKNLNVNVSHLFAGSYYLRTFSKGKSQEKIFIKI